jgi:hypothetical protein
MGDEHDPLLVPMVDDPLRDRAEDLLARDAAAGRSAIGVVLGVGQHYDCEGAFGRGVGLGGRN